MRHPIQLVFLFLVALSAAVLPAAEDVGVQRTAVGPVPAANPSASPPLEFRRVYAPADQLKDWPRQAIRYVPMKPEDFEGLVSSAQAALKDAPSISASIRAAGYRATLDADGTLHGDATLNIAHDQDHQVVLPLSPCGLAITQANWLGTEPQAAELGLAVEGKLALLVKRSGQLHLQWSLRGRQEAAGAWQFTLDLPACPTSSLVLELPANLQPIVTPGVAVGEVSDDSSRGRWSIELGGHHRVSLRLVVRGQSEPRRQLTLVRDLFAYDLSLHGLDLSAELRLDVHNEPLREIVLAMDPRLELVKAQYGDVAVPWSILSPPSEGRSTRVLLQLPEPIQGVGRILRLGAVAPLQLDSRWHLPAIRMEGMLWQEGIATIGVRAPLNLEQLLPIRGRQSKTGALSGPRPGQSAEIQYFAEDAGVEVLLTQSRAQLQLESGTSVELSGGEITGRVVAELTVADGELFQLEADVGRQWLIDSVEAEPADILHDGWTVKKEDDGSEKLAVHLDKALSPTRPVRLIVAGRRLHAPSGQPLNTDDLTLLRFTETAGRKRLLAVHAVEPYRLKLEGAERLKRIEPEMLTDAQRRLFQPPPWDLVFADDAGAASLQISLVTPKPSYSATIRAEATAFASKAGTRSHWLRESYWVRCVPDAARADRVLIHFCSSRTMPPKWSLVAGAEGQFEARRLSAAEQASAMMDTRGETWELVFRQPKTTPFEIHATRLVQWDDGMQPVSLICVPEAAQQQGSLAIRSLGGTAIRIHGARLDPLPPEEVPAEHVGTARARFRYNPMTDAVRADQPAVTLELEKPAVPAAWIWSCQLESRYQVQGIARHLVTYRMESNGKPQLDLTLPRSTSLDKIAGIWSDGRPASWQSIGETSDRHVVVELPEDRRFPVVSLQFQTDSGPLRTSELLEPQLPSVDVPVLTQQWTVWLPPGYAADARGPFQLASRETALGWSERIFGPLGRPASASPFDPLAVGSWTKLVGSDPEVQSLRQSASQFIQRLSILEQKDRQASVPAGGNSPAAKAVTWGALLPASVEGTDQVLLIDGPALARLHLDPHTTVIPIRSDAPLARGIALLEHGRLALLVFPEGLLLTSAGDADSYHPHLVPLEGETLWRVRRGPLADRLQHAAESRQDPIFFPVDQWQRQPANPGAPWLVPSVGDQPLETLGWNVYRMAFSPDTPPHLSVTCQDTAQSFQWVVFLTTLALLWWIARERPAVSIAVLAVAAAAALVLAEPYSSLLSGVVIGALMAVVLYLIRYRKTQDNRSSAHARQPQLGVPDRTGVETGTALLLALSFTSVTCSARAGDAAAKAAPAPRVVHNVLIPVDRQQRPDGSNYFVPEALYQQLQREASKPSEQPEGWLLRGASYRGTLARQSTPEQLVIRELKAVFDLEVFNPSTRIRIPLGREGVNLLPDGATLDGRVIEPEWLESDGALVLDVRQPGPYRLELSLRPTVQSFGSSYGIDLRIPRLATSRLELILPTDAPAIEVPSATGSVTLEQAPPRLVAQLGASDRLTVRWPNVAESTRIGPAMDVEQLCWLKVHPGSVVLGARLKVKVIEGVVRRLRLAVDPRLRLLPFRDPDSPVAQVQTTAGEPQTLQFDMAQPVSDQVVVEANFLLAGTSGIGNVRLPQIQVMDARVTKRWLAISVDRALVYEQQAADRLEPVAVPVFEAAWGKTDAPPALAYSLPSSQPAWSLATHPDEPRITVDQLTALSFAPGVARVQFDAQVVTTGNGFQYHLSAPKQFQVESVAVEDSLQRVARWSRDEEGGITVFLNEPASGKQHLTLRGKMNTPIRGPAVLPVLTVDGTNVHSCEIQVFREPSVLVELTEVKGLTEVDLPLVADDKAQLGRLVKSYRVPDSRKTVGATVNLAPNQPELVADQVTYLRAKGNAWAMTADFHVAVRRGMADEFRVRMPPNCSGPFQIDPPTTYRIVESSGNGHRELVIQPPSAIDREYRFRISAALAVQPGQRLNVPSMRLLDADRGRSLLVLPKQLDSKPINWETRALKPVANPPGLASSPIAPESPATFELQATSFQAVLNLVDHTSRTPNVLLADIHLAWQADGNYQGLAAFDLEPVNLSQCPLLLPSHARLICVAVDGVPAVPQPKAEHLWQVPLQSDTIPQRVEVLFAGRLPSPASTGLFLLEAPALGRLPTLQTLWTISGPANLQPHLPASVEAAEPLQMDLVRLKGIASVADLIVSLSMRPNEFDKTDQWQGIWRRRWEACRQQIRQQSAGTPLPSRGTTASQIAALDRKYKEFRGQLDRGGSSTSEATESWILDPAQLGQGWMASPQTTVRCIAAAGPSVLLVHVRDAQTDPWLYRVLGVLGCMLLLPAIALGSVRRSAFRVCCRWPAVVGVAVGLAWWLWLEPSILGWLVILAALTVSLVPAWRRFRPGSSVIAVNLTHR